jgi:alpha-tubulin suppressor-like RCC1 family protein
MKQLLRLLHCLVLVLGLATLLAPAHATAQVLPGTFAAGSTHSLSIHADGTLWATGDNEYGQLGLPASTPNSAGWVQVGTATNWVQVAAGQYHSLGLRADGTLYAWGKNAYGQLGSTTNNGSDTANPTPTLVPGIYTQVAAGNDHSLGLRADGTLYAWGDNYESQLGNPVNSGLDIPTTTPTQVAGIYTQVVAGSYHTLALRADGSLWAWGYNGNGQLGFRNGGASTPTPTQVPGTYSRVAAGGFHSLGLREDGTLYAWGNNSSGQLGNGTSQSTATPTPVPGTYTRMAAGYSFTLGLRADGTLYAWGNNYSGQLGNTVNNGSGTANPTPIQVAGTYAQVAAGHSHSLALRADGALVTWGFNGNGELGSSTSVGTYTANPAPTATGTALPTRSTAAGTDHGLAVRADGTLWSWGANDYGQLGNGTTTASPVPVQVGTDRDWVMVAGGRSYSLGLKANGALYAWGLNSFGQLGVAATSGTLVATSTPTRVGTDLYIRIAAGDRHSLGLRPDGTLWAWGANTSGQLGSTINNGTNTANPTPIQVGTALYTQVATGESFTLALRPDGTLWSWGNNGYGQLGNNFIRSSTSTATQVGVDLYTQVAAGGSHSLGLRADGSLYAWGLNYYGQLGNATNNSNFNTNPTPARVGTDLYTQVAAGQYHTLGLRPDGTLWAWGYNREGQLGRGNDSREVVNYMPTQEITAGTGWVTLAPGSLSLSSLVRTASGLNFASTGANYAGQLGDGTTTDATRFDRLRPLGSSQPLPVQLIAFQAQRSGPATVALTWVTASEVNNAGFGVEKSVDGRAWLPLAFVPGAGTSSTRHTYAYLDAQGTAAAYYRLAQTDLNGTRTYSPVQYVSGASQELSLYPNPTINHATALHGATPGVAVQVLDALGRVVSTATTDASGTATLSGLPAGLYLVRADGQVQRLAVE